MSEAKVILSPAEKALIAIEKRERDSKVLKFNNQSVVRATKQDVKESHRYNDWRNW